MIRPLAPFVNQNAQETYAYHLVERMDGLLHYPRLVDKIFVLRPFPRCTQRRETMDKRLKNL